MADKTIIMGVFLSLVFLLAISLAGCSTSSDFKDALSSTRSIEGRYNISIHDYSNGVAYFKYHPRYPNPMNIEDIENATAEFSDIKEDLEEGTAEMYLVDAWLALLESEKLYKLATKTTKGITSDGFGCKDIIFVEAATINFMTSVEHGRSAVENLRMLTEEYPDEAEMINITKFWVKYLNLTYDVLEDYAGNNRGRIIRMCANKDNTVNITQLPLAENNSTSNTSEL